MANVLIIDDDPKLLEMMAEFLTMKGWTTATAASGRAGLAEAARRVPDVVLSDVNLPDIDGFAVARALHDGAATADVPIVLISGAEKSPKSVEKGLDEGSQGYLLKPVDLRLMEAKLKALLQRG